MRLIDAKVSQEELVRIYFVDFLGANPIFKSSVISIQKHIRRLLVQKKYPLVSKKDDGDKDESEDESESGSENKKNDDGNQNDD